MKRLPAIRQLHGPLRPTKSQRERVALRSRIAHLREAGKADYAWWHPESDPVLTATACDRFTEAFLTWCAHGTPDAADFQNHLFQSIFALPVPDDLGGRLFVHWIETLFYDVWPTDLDPDLALCLEEAYMAMLDDIPAWNWRLQMKQLVNLWMPHSDGEDGHPVRAGPVHAMPRSHASRFSLWGQDERRRDH